MSIKLTTPESVGLCSTRLNRIKESMQEWVDSGELVGLTTMVARKGEIVHFQNLGLSDREENKPMQPDSLFRLYSMTKPIVCTAFMTLYEQGKFDLKDPVSKYIPEFSNLKVLEKDDNGHEVLVDLDQPVSIHHLLTHTSGLVYDFYEDSPVCELYRQNKIVAYARSSLQEFVQKLCELPLAFQPGQKWYYSVSIDVIGYLIEVISSKPLKQFLAESIFKPLDMHDTNFYVPEEKRHRIAKMYGGVDLCGPNKSWTDFLNAWEARVNECIDVSETSPIDDNNFMRGGSGLVGSATDYMRFAQMLLNKGTFNGKRLLSPKTVDFMHMNHVDENLLPIGFADWKLTGFGFGLGSRVLYDVAESQILGSAGEYGWAGAAKTYYWIDPKEELIGIFMPQSMTNFSMAERQFQTLVYQAIID